MDVNDNEQTPEPTLRDELAAAFDKAEADNEPDKAPAPEPASDEPKAPASADPDTGPARDEKGRFLPKQQDKADGDHGAAPKVGAKAVEGTPSAAPPAPKVDEPPPPVKVEPVEKAPQSWKPLAREHWAALPPDVRQEVQRREREVAQTLQESAEARKGYQAFREAVAPYEAMIRAEGSEPARAVAALLQTAAALRTAPPVQRAQMIAQMVQAYSVPIDALDAALAGRAPPPGSAQHGPVQDPRVDQLLAKIEAAQRQQREVEAKQSEQLVTTFAEKHEFFEDVREDMADLIEVAQRRGYDLSLEDAYNRAIAMNPDIAKVVQQREAAKAAATARAATQKARNAASSIKPSAAIAPSREGRELTLREQLEESMDSLSGR